MTRESRPEHAAAARTADEGMNLLDGVEALHDDLAGLCELAEGLLDLLDLLAHVADIRDGIDDVWICRGEGADAAEEVASLLHLVVCAQDAITCRERGLASSLDTRATRTDSVDAFLCALSLANALHRMPEVVEVVIAALETVDVELGWLRHGERQGKARVIRRSSVGVS